MAHSGAGRALATKGGYPVKVSGNLHGDVGYLDCEPASSAVWTLRKGKEKEQKYAPARMIIVEQWICFVWGFVCMAFGIWGICMKSERDALPPYIAWLGSLHMPALHVTAVACLGMGVVLIGRGWTHL